MTPEFSIRFMDEAYAEENATIQKAGLPFLASAGFNYCTRTGTVSGCDSACH